MDTNELMEFAKKYPRHLGQPFDEIYVRFGFDVLYYLLKEFGGTYFYFPNVRTVFKNCYIEQIKKEFNGHNFKKLASKFGMCERTIRDIVNG